MGKVHCGIRAPIPDDDAVWRTFKESENYLEFDVDANDWRPAATRQAFHFDEVTHEMSAKWREHLEEDGWVAGDLVDEARGYTLVYEADVGQLREVQADTELLTVEHTPEDGTPPGCAHSSVYWPERLSGESREARDKRHAVRTKLGELFRRRHGTITLEPPP